MTEYMLNSANVVSSGMIDLKLLRKYTLRSKAVPAPEAAIMPTAITAWIQWKWEKYPLFLMVLLCWADANCRFCDADSAWVVDGDFTFSSIIKKAKQQCHKSNDHRHYHGLNWEKGISKHNKKGPFWRTLESPSFADTGCVVETVGVGSCHLDMFLMLS